MVTRAQALALEHDQGVMRMGRHTTTSTTRPRDHELDQDTAWEMYHDTRRGPAVEARMSENKGIGR